MALKEKIDSELGELKSEAQAFVDSNVEYYQLKIFKSTSKVSSIVLKIFIISFFSLVALLFVSLASAFALSECLGSMALGFLVVGSVYLFLVLLLYFFRKQLLDPIVIRKLSDIFFN